MSSFYSSTTRWLLQQGPDAKKHKGPAHPIITFVLHYIVVTVSAFFAHDVFVVWTLKYFGNSDDKECTVSPEMRRRRRIVGIFLASYFSFYFCIRLALQWKSKPYKLYSEFYQQTFMCSMTIFNSALSLYCDRPIVSHAFCILVGMDQLMWYIDIVGYILLGAFPIGVCKYLFKPGFNWVNRFTSSHHLWTIPLVLWSSGGNFHWLALPLSFVLVPVTVFMSRCMIPVAIRSPKEHGEQDLYLNINLSQEMVSHVTVMRFS